MQLINCKKKKKNELAIEIRLSNDHFSFRLNYQFAIRKLMNSGENRTKFHFYCESIFQRSI